MSRQSTTYLYIISKIKNNFFLIVFSFFSSALLAENLSSKEDLHEAEKLLTYASQCENKKYYFKSLVYYADYQTPFEYRNFLEEKGISKEIIDKETEDEIASFIELLNMNFFPPNEKLEKLEKFSSTFERFNNQYIDNKITIRCTSLNMGIIIYSGGYIINGEEYISGEIVNNNKRYSFLTTLSVAEKVVNISYMLFDKNNAIAFYKL